MAIIDKPSDYFNTVLYTGDGTTARGITGVGFQPDFTWIKRRSADAYHFLTDTVRGATKTIYSNRTNAEATQSLGLQSFDSDGFTVGSNADVNGNTQTFVGWNWLAGGTAVSNTDGSITSSVSANTDAGFSIVSYTGTGSGSATIGHGLGIKPKVVLIKSRSLAKNWIYWQDTNGDGSGETRLVLNLTNADYANYPVTFNTNTITLPSLSDDSWSTSSATYIAYCFAEKQGYSKFGKYTGNGSTDGTFVYTGFKPAVFIVKKTSGTANWEIRDNKRTNSFNTQDERLFPNLSNAGNSSEGIDFISNGLKLRGTSSNWNDSGGTYIYMAFAENPFTTSTGVPATAR